MIKMSKEMSNGFHAESRESIALRKSHVTARTSTAKIREAVIFAVLVLSCRFASLGS